MALRAGPAESHNNADDRINLNKYPLQIPSFNRRTRRLINAHLPPIAL